MGFLYYGFPLTGASVLACAPKWTRREIGFLKTSAVIGTGIGVTAATGGAGLAPYLYSVGAAAGTSIALDAEVQARLATGDWPGAATQASYHLPLLGNARSGLAAWQQGDRSEAAFYAALFSLETLGLKGAGRRPVGPRVADGAKGGNPYIGKPKPELLKSKSSYEKLIKEHQA